MHQVLLFFELVEGTYDFTTSFEITDGDDSYTFNGFMANFNLLEEISTTMDLVMASNSGGFVFKEIYYSGSRTP